MGVGHLLLQSAGHRNGSHGRRDPRSALHRRQRRQSRVGHLYRYHIQFNSIVFHELMNDFDPCPAIMIGVRIFGPVLGFALGSLCTSLYVDPFLDPDVTPKDPRKDSFLFIYFVLFYFILFFCFFNSMNSISLNSFAFV